jgi:hypothetical protein
METLSLHLRDDPYTMRMILSDIRKAVNYFEKSSVCEAWKQSLKSMGFRVKINSQLGEDAGLCCFNPNTGLIVIELNSVLLRRATDQERFYVVAHELAHALMYYMFGSIDDVHNARWQEIVVAMGGESQTIHNLCLFGINGRMFVIVHRKTHKQYYCKKEFLPYVRLAPLGYLFRIYKGVAS